MLNRAACFRYLAFFRYIIISTFTLWLAGCATLAPNYEKPKIHITSIQVLEPDGFTQKFSVGLRLINPNSTSLQLSGMFYSISLEGFEVISGVTNQIPSVPGYSSTDFTVETSTNLINSIRFINDVLQHPKKQLNYELKAKMQGSNLFSSTTVVETGQIQLNH
ncbi:LEA type 2 family protein [Spartinivicinus poritis]|uniref:LEA type 2 family protein n=1 Tax=Spartinivicinus poritis TaxID=2994640 RepID=A0ABT5U6J1_9GAMM|nr:LEA type 2 family protein [Spartinivicinus sp. A2-2]MDE1461989.1 LEA type 2 family protein [Spartinivicinus sp. A2-2]